MKINNLKRICLLTFMIVAIVISVSAADMACVRLQNGILTFYYGTLESTGRCWEVKPGYCQWSTMRTEITKVVFDSSFAQARPTDCSNWFSECNNLTEIEGLEYLNTSEVDNMYSMFYRCKKLTAIDVSHFNTSKVKNFSLMFQYDNIENLDVSNFDTSSAENMSGMFMACTSLQEIDVNSFNTSNVKNMSYMFYGCKSLETIDVSGFNTSNVTDMSDMFYLCTSLKTIDVSGFNTSNVTNMSGMFDGCSGLTSLDVSGFNTSNVTNMHSMFSDCSGLTSLDVNCFDMQNVMDVESMFYSCKKLTTIFCDKSWICNNSTDMFRFCEDLNGAIAYDVARTNCTYANPVTGYFTNLPDTFDIKIAGTSVTSINCNDLTAISGVTGTASYDPDTKTLYLEDASIAELTSTGGYALHTTLDTLRINVTGDCSISSSRGTGIFANSRNVVISGTGTLDITAGANGIVMNNTSTNTLDIDGKVTVNVTAENYGIQGREYIQRVGLTGTTKTYYRTTLKTGGEGSKLSVNGTAKCFQTLGGFTPADGYEVTAPSRTAYFGTVEGVAYNTFCRSTLEFSGIGKTQTTTVTLTPVAGVAVVIEKPYILGDVNGDGNITMADANEVVNYFLATDKSAITNFNVDAANVNGDDGITIADANEIVGMFLGQ